MSALIINQLLYLAFTIGMAYYHSRLIKKNKPIKHGWWALAAIGVAGLFGLINWLYIPIMLMMRALVFSPILSKFRGLRWDYLSRSTGSVLDRIEAKIFRTFKIKTVVYFIVYATITIILILLDAKRD